MRKTLLILCAFIASIGAWAQDTNVAKGKTVTLTTGDVYAGTHAGDLANMVDGDDATVWQASWDSYDSKTTCQFTIDLGSATSIDGFAITFSGNRWVTQFKLEYSTDGSSWSDFGNGTYSTGVTIDEGATKTISDAFASPVTAKYVRYTSSKTDKVTADQYGETIKEFQLIQYATGAMVPPTHNDVFDAIYTSSHTNAHWEATYNGGATSGVEAYYGGVPIQPFTSVKCVFFGVDAWNGSFNVSSKEYKELCLDIYTTEKSDNYIIKLEGATTKDRAISLNQTGWNTVKIDISDETNISNVSLRHKDGEGASTGVLGLSLANIYFTQAVEDIDNYVITSLTASPSIVKKNTATAITFTPQNANGTNLTAYGSSKVTVAYAITSGTGTLSDGTLTITGDDPVVITATATRVSDNHVSTATTTINLYPAAPADPTENSENVVAVYSETYSATSPSYATSGWGNPNCTFSSKEEIDLGTNNNALHVIGDGIGFGINFTAEGTKLSDYAEIYFDIYPANAVTSGKVFVEQEAQSFANFTATAGSWQTKHFTFTASSDKAAYLFISLGAGATNDFFLDNIYFVKKDNSKVYIGEESNGMVTVTGTVTTANVSQVEAITAKVIDLRSATLNGVTGITLKDNQLLLVASEKADNEGQTSAMATALTGNTSNVIIKNATNEWYFAMKPIVYTDQNERQPVSFSINTLTQGYTITRSIPAEKYVTAAPMANVTAPEGIDVYEFTGYTAGSVTFTKKADRSMSVKTPYVLRNTTASPINLVVTGTGDLNPTVDAVTVTPTGTSANFVANLIELTTTGTQYVLSNGEIHKGNGVKVGAFRAYFTGVAAAAGARALFVDGETTKIGTINANGEIETGEVYNLSGQRVQNPSKGLYIVNGKKVILK